MGIKGSRVYPILCPLSFIFFGGVLLAQIFRAQWALGQVLGFSLFSSFNGSKPLIPLLKGVERLLLLGGASPGGRVVTPLV